MDIFQSLIQQLKTDLPLFVAPVYSDEILFAKICKDFYYNVFRIWNFSGSLPSSPSCTCCSPSSPAPSTQTWLTFRTSFTSSTGSSQSYKSRYRSLSFTILNTRLLFILWCTDLVIWLSISYRYKDVLLSDLRKKALFFGVDLITFNLFII
jgi:hypothetical protein